MEELTVMRPNRICLIIATSFLMYSGSTSLAQSYPLGLSQQHIEIFEELDRQTLDALAKMKGTAPLQIPAAFGRQHSARIIENVFGDDLSPVKAYADAALAEIPEIDPTDIMKRKWLYSIRNEEMLPGIGKDNVTSSPEFERTLVTSRMWHPSRMTNSAISTSMGVHLDKEDIARDAMQRSLLSAQLYRANWAERDALVAMSGSKAFIIDYARTTHGLFYMTNITAYER